MNESNEELHEKAPDSSVTPAQTSTDSGPLTKPKKPRTAKQMEVFKKCAETRKRNIELKKQEKEKMSKKTELKQIVIESESEEDSEEVVYIKKKPRKKIILKKPKLKRSTNIVYVKEQPSSSSESEEEDSDEQEEQSEGNSDSGDDIYQHSNTNYYKANSKATPRYLNTPQFI